MLVFVLVYAVEKDTVAMGDGVCPSDKCDQCQIGNHSDFDWTLIGFECLMLGAWLVVWQSSTLTRTASACKQFI